MAESVVQIVALAEDLINGVDQFIVIEAFELGFVDIEIFGNDAQNVYRFVIAAVGRIENCVLILLVFYDIQKLKTDRISVLIGKDNKIGIHNCNILLGVLFAAQKHANLKLLYYEEVNLKRKK